MLGRDVEEMASLDPEVRQAVHRAQQALRDGDAEGAERALREATEALDVGDHDRPRIERMIEQAERALEDEDREAAQQALQQVRQTFLQDWRS